MEHVEMYDNLPWAWMILSLKEFITADFIKRHPYMAWNWEYLSANEFNKHPKMLKHIDKKIKLREDIYSVISTQLTKGISHLVTLYL